jgi:hypothetical protein
MKRKKPIQLKAAFLLIVFSLNTIIGFACAVGLNMGFNSHHHEQSAIEATENHHHDKSHHHDEADVSHQKTNNDKDNCCNDEVMKFQQVDKNIATSFSLISPVFFTSFLASFYHIDLLSSNDRISTIKYFVRRHHPPIPDIRIAIQSFQI